MHDSTSTWELHFTGLWSAAPQCCPGYIHACKEPGHQEEMTNSACTKLVSRLAWVYEAYKKTMSGPEQGLPFEAPRTPSLSGDEFTKHRDLAASFVVAGVGMSSFAETL